MNKTSLLLRNKQNGLAPILIVILIALVVGGYLLYQKQTKSISQPQLSSSPVASDETANWKTYTNDKYNFSFKYPADLEVERDGDKWASFAGERNEDERGIVNRFGVDADMTIDDFEKIFATPDNLEITGKIAGWGEKAIKIKNLVIDGEKAAQYKTISTVNVNPDPESFPTFLTVVEHNENVVKVLYHSGLETNNYTSDYNKILSTFKFTSN